MNALLVALPLLLTAAEDNSKPNALTPKEIADGWILLFDGETTFGWKVEGEAKVDQGTLILGGTKDATATVTTQFGYGTLVFEAFTDEASDTELTFNGYTKGPFIHVVPPMRKKGWHYFSSQVQPDDISIWASGTKGFAIKGKYNHPTRIAFHVPSGQKLPLVGIKFRPLNLKPIFTGKDLTGWKEIPGHKSKFTVNDKGELNVKDGNGDLQTEGQWDDFVLQLDVISNGKHLNSGVFFRAIPGQFWSGYESQIRNQWQGEDRTKPVDYGTGGIYNRQPSRKVVSSDNEWFTKTIVAHGNHLAVWVNGYQTADFTDTRPMNKSARQGCKLDKGPISLQGHDPTTDLSFRNIRIGELPK